MEIRDRGLTNCIIRLFVRRAEQILSKYEFELFFEANSISFMIDLMGLYSV